MKRRNFFTSLFGGASAVAVAAMKPARKAGKRWLVWPSAGNMIASDPELESVQHSQRLRVLFNGKDVTRDVLCRYVDEERGIIGYAAIRKDGLLVSSTHGDWDHSNPNLHAAGCIVAETLYGHVRIVVDPEKA